MNPLDLTVGLFIAAARRCRLAISAFGPLGMTVGVLIAVALIAVAAYFAWRQRVTLQILRFDLRLTRDHRNYLLHQVWRRLFGSLLLFLLAVMLVGSLFLDYEPQDVLQVEPEAAKQAVRFLSGYVMAMLLLLMVMLTVAVFDFWATARFGVQQRKQLVLEHQELLEAELTALRHRRSELN